MSVIRKLSFVKNKETLSPFVEKFSMSRELKHHPIVIRNDKEETIVVLVEGRHMSIVCVKSAIVIVALKL